MNLEPTSEYSYGPAFPSHKGGPSLHDSGITVRDYFAAKAMQAMLSIEHMPDEAFERIATRAYKMADMMTLERYPELPR